MKTGKQNQAVEKAAHLHMLRGLLASRPLKRGELMKLAKVGHEMDGRMCGVRLWDLEHEGEVTVEGEQGPKQLLTLTDKGRAEFQAGGGPMASAAPAVPVDDELRAQILASLPRTMRDLVAHLKSGVKAHEIDVKHTVLELQKRNWIQVDSGPAEPVLQLGPAVEDLKAQILARLPCQGVDLFASLLADFGTGPKVAEWTCWMLIRIDGKAGWRGEGARTLTRLPMADAEPIATQATDTASQPLDAPGDQSPAGTAPSVLPEDLEQSALSWVMARGDEGAPKGELNRFLVGCGLDPDVANQLSISLYDRGYLVVGQDKRFRVSSTPPRFDYAAIRTAAIAHVRQQPETYAGLMVWLCDHFGLEREPAHTAACKLLEQDLIDAAGLLLPRAPVSDGKVPIAEAFASGERMTAGEPYQLPLIGEWAEYLRKKQDLKKVEDKLAIVKRQRNDEYKAGMKGVKDELVAKYGERQAGLEEELSGIEKLLRDTFDGLERQTLKMDTADGMKEARAAAAKKNGTQTAAAAQEPARVPHPVFGAKDQELFPGVAQQAENAAVPAPDAAVPDVTQDAAQQPPADKDQPTAAEWKAVGERFDKLSIQAAEDKLASQSLLAKWDAAFDTAWSEENMEACKALLSDLGRAVKIETPAADQPAAVGWPKSELNAKAPIGNFLAAVDRAPVDMLRAALGELQGQPAKGIKGRIKAIESRLKKIERQTAQAPDRELVNA